MYCAGDYHANLGTIGAAIQDARSTKKTEGGFSDYERCN